MNLLMVKRKEKKKFKFLREALEEKGFEVKNVNLKELSLFSQRKNSRIEGPELSLDDTKGVYMESGLKVTQFVEPLLDELERRGVYCQVKKSSHFILSNELLQITVLNNYNVKIPRTLIFKDPGKVKTFAKKLSFPLLFKTFANGKKSQSFIVGSEKSLVSVSKGIKHELDGIVLREFIKGDIQQCAVVGKNVFALRRKFEKEDLQPIKKASMTTVSSKDKEAAIHAANVCNCDIATVKMCKGYVLKVKPLVNYLVFNKKIGDNLFESVADLFAEKTSLSKKEKPEKEGSENE